MADVYSAECLSGFCSQCDFPSCACLHHLEDQEGDTDAGDYDEDDLDDDDAFDDYDWFDCGMKANRATVEWIDEWIARRAA